MTGSRDSFWGMFPTLLYSRTKGPKLDADAHRAIQKHALASTCAVAGRPAVRFEALDMHLSRADMLTLMDDQPNAHVINFYMGLLQVVPLALAAILAIWVCKALRTNTYIAVTVVFPSYSKHCLKNLHTCVLKCWHRAFKHTTSWQTLVLCVHAVSDGVTSICRRGATCCKMIRPTLAATSFQWSSWTTSCGE